MFILTVGLLAAFVASFANGAPGRYLIVALGLICIGTLATIVRRTLRIAGRLHEP
jgi:hypothetical protein